MRIENSVNNSRTNGKGGAGVDITDPCGQLEKNSVFKNSIFTGAEKMAQQLRALYAS